MIYDISPVNNYDGNNLATRFDFDFYIESPDELKVYHYSSDGAKTLLIYEVDYTINELRNQEGSYITFPIEGSEYEVLKEGERISLQMFLPISQETQYNNSSLLNLSALEYSLDYLTRLIQIVARKLELCVKSEEGADVSPQEIINNIVEIGTSVLSNVEQIAQDMQEIETLAQSATQMYNSVSSWVESLENLQEAVNTLSTSKLNIEGDNISSSVKAIDGQWVFPNSAPLFVDLDTTTSSKQSFDISTFLPVDSYSYEVLFVGEFHHSSSSGNNLEILIKAPNNSNYTIPFLYSSNSAQHQHNSIVLPVGADRTIAFKTSSSGFNTGRIYLTAYKRIGTNV